MTLRAIMLATSAILAFADGFSADPQPYIPRSVIIVTAQRQSQSLQEVPIAVSAFDATALESQQIENAADLQLTLPNVSFSKGNFTGSSFTIRGIGDLCVGVTCDAATAIHINGSPLFGTRLFETEYFDLERIEVLRGPQGTLFGRNATSGVVNLVTAKPDLGSFGAAGEFEYGNYNSIKAEGMVNVPIGDSIGVRVAGFFLNRDGYTTNLFDNSMSTTGTCTLSRFSSLNPVPIPLSTSWHIISGKMTPVYVIKSRPASVTRSACWVV